jgi:hypothetical protein
VVPSVSHQRLVRMAVAKGFSGNSEKAGDVGLAREAWLVSTGWSRAKIQFGMQAIRVASRVLLLNYFSLGHQHTQEETQEKGAMSDPDDVSHALLLRLFQSEFFSPHLALS